jgi:organic radical activating enzyme
MRQRTKEILKKFIPEWILQFLRIYRTNKRIKRRSSLCFEVHLADHCNLNCKNCSHFSPLVKENYLDVAKFQLDCQKISELSCGELKRIRFMGGEPLLHSNIIDFLTIGRKYFSKADLEIWTNGILLPKQNQEFWETCRIKKVLINISKYPIKIDKERINNLAKQHNVKLVYQYNKKELLWFNTKLNKNGRQNIEKSFRFCDMSNECIHLCEGKLYTCPVIAYVKYLNNYFDENFEVTENDYIDIYKVKSMGEILDFLCKPVPFCKYCDKASLAEWGISKKERKEWIDE